MNISLESAQNLDAKYQSVSRRNQFHIPQHNGKDTIYLCGNSLGLQPKNTADEVNQIMTDWATLGVEGHFYAKNPWWTYHKLLQKGMAEVVGALPEETIVMNNLTVNLHLMMVSFYRPTNERYKIIMEAGAFPSDQYAVETQVKHHGFAPSDAIIEVAPRPGEDILRTEDIVSVIEQNADSLALVMFGGINYYTGQVFDLKTITEAGHKAGAVVGFDLAHAAGNVELHLHDWDVDFAVWCTYKYMNSGPGAVAGAYVHSKHGNNPELNRFAGWWGYHEETRFKMTKGFVPMTGAAGWQLANGTILSMACVKASLDLFTEVGFSNLVAKSKELTAFLEQCLIEMAGDKLNIITPQNTRGCQLSLRPKAGKAFFTYLMDKGVICDWREPDVVRLAPTPLYNTFEDCFRAAELISRFNA